LKKLIENYLNEFAEAKDSIFIKDIEKVYHILLEAWLYGRWVFICGNGGSASTASHFASDLSKVGLKVYCLNDNPARTTALVNDSGWGRLYIEQLENRFNPKDVLVAFSVHGGIGEDKGGKWSQNLLQAIEYAQTHGGKAIGIVGFEGGIMRKVCDASIKVNVLSTPYVESWHLALCHLLCECLENGEVRPNKACRDCGMVVPYKDSCCPYCHSDRFYLVAGMIGNVEDLKRDNIKSTH
jgi:D-sedoheptulose 7-phosphate isomerase